MEQLDIRNLLENIEEKVYHQEITSSSDVNKLINTEIAHAINLKYKKESSTETSVQSIPYATVDNYLDHLKALEQKLKKPANLSTQGAPVEERDINRRLLLILNRLKGYSRK